MESIKNRRTIRKYKQDDVPAALLNELPERSRQVMIMSHIENRKSADIARKLGISVRTVETILYQAMKKLRGKIKK